METKEKYIKRFQDLYKLKNGKEITPEEALGYFEMLISLVSAIYQPIKK